MNTGFAINDILCEIRKKKLAYDTFSASEQLLIKENRNKPDLDLQHHDGGTAKKFNTQWYDDYPWLCGSKTFNRLFCIACALYGGDQAWGFDGIEVIRKFHERANKHQTTKIHCTNMEQYVLAGRARKVRGSDDEKKKEMGQMQRKEILSRLIDLIIAVNRYGRCGDIFGENSVGQMMLRKYLCDISLYRQIYMEVNETLIKTMESRMFADIKKELSQTEFCSLLIDEIPTRDKEYSVMVRYIHGGKVKERFVGFYKIVQIFDLAQIFNQVTGDVRKAVCHSYDGCSAMKPLRLGIKSIMPKLLYLPSHLHALSALVLQNLESIDEFRTFVRNVSYVCNFFKSPRRSYYLKKSNMAAPLETETLWRFHSNAILNLRVHRYRILKVVNSIFLDPNVGDLDMVNSAYCVQKILNCPLFAMFCSLYAKVYIYISHLSNTFQKKLGEDDLIQEVLQVIKSITNLKTSVTITLCIEENKAMMSSEGAAEKTKVFKSCAPNILGLIVVQISEIFFDLKHLKFVRLLDETKFTSYWNRFPKTLFADCMDFYKTFFDSSRLEEELMKIYADAQKRLNPYALFCYLYDNELADVYKETYRLLKLYLTYPLLKVNNSGTCTVGKLRKFLDLPENQMKSAVLYVDAYPQATSAYADFKKNVVESMS
ncbi:uncharacterized protein LOC123680294 [Harmonia axyridis]|uniref:uncharacterized protein LOC123680294 n=1 Tax=Harmonia axyridis TaxID=115357 RepID=UPI001E279299|nr:uncharacterized protein LOC123680294 [Harmonia axyridis]